MNLPAAFGKYRAAIDSELRMMLAERQSVLYDMIRYHLGWVDEDGNPQEGPTGKALRSTLCLLACEAVGGEYRQALPAAVAIELVHNFSLVHDDIQDDDRERRHRPTVWNIWGKPQAMNAGMAMRALASLTLLRLNERAVSAEKQLRVQRLIDESSLRLIEGQYLDISNESRFDIGVSDYLDMIDKKTASLIACSLEVGALLGSDNDYLPDSFRDIGGNLGLGFQIRDDILGIWGDEEKTGKPLGSDMRHRQKTLPIVYALGKADGRLRQELVSIYQNGAFDEGDIVTVLTILDTVDAQLQAQKMAERYCDKAIEAIAKLALLPSAKHDLEKVAHFLVERSF